jgi:IS5 family transposase
VFEPYRAHFHATLGRPSVPIETYLRLMFLKYRYRLGFAPLCREAAASISWQRFARSRWARRCRTRRAGEVANRLPRTHQLPQTRLRLVPHPYRRHRRRQDLCGHGVFNHNLIKIAALTSQTA